MAKRNLDTAVIAAIAVATIVTFNTANEFIDTPIKVTFETASKPTAVVTAKVKQSTQVPTETTRPATEATAPTYNAPPTILYDVPLATDLQLHIVQIAESYGIDPAIIFAMCYLESTFNPASIGDDGESFGLMQIQPKWHSDRMARLNCSDLLDPFQNVIVGTDYLAEQLARYGGNLSKALVAYNAGHFKGTITNYAMVVMATAEELRGATYESHKQSKSTKNRN